MRSTPFPRLRHWQLITALLILVSGVAEGTAQEEATPREAPTGYKELAYRGQPLGKVRRGRITWAILPDVYALTEINYTDGRHDSCNLDVYLPIKNGDEFGTAPRPAILFVHGGGWRSGSRKDALWTAWPLEYAQKGYVTIAVDYRLSGEAPFPAAVEDVKNAVRWVRAHAAQLNIDPERIGAVGHSAGGHLVEMLGVVPDEAGFAGDGPLPQVSGKVRAVVAVAGLADFAGHGAARNRPGSFLAGPEETYADRIRRVSPLNYVTKDAAAFLLVHGVKDGTVPVASSDKFKVALENAGVRVEYLRVEGATHDVHRTHVAQVRPVIDAFLQRVLNP